MGRCGEAGRVSGGESRNEGAGQRLGRWEKREHSAKGARPVEDGALGGFTSEFLPLIYGSFVRFCLPHPSHFPSSLLSLSRFPSSFLATLCRRTAKPEAETGGRGACPDFVGEVFLTLQWLGSPAVPFAQDTRYGLRCLHDGGCV